MLEGENHVEFPVFRGCVAQCVLDAGTCAFTDREPVIAGDGFPVHLLKEFMDAGAVVGVGRCIAVLTVHDTVRETLVLADHGNDVHPETVDSLVAPVPHEVVDGLPDPDVLPVEVGLLF